MPKITESSQVCKEFSCMAHFIPRYCICVLYYTVLYLYSQLHRFCILYYTVL